MLLKSPLLSTYKRLCGIKTAMPLKNRCVAYAPWDNISKKNILSPMARDAQAGLTSHLKPQKIWNFRIFPKIMQKYQPKLKTIRFVIFGVELRMSRNQFFNIFTSDIFSIFDSLKVITILRIWIFMNKNRKFWFG